MSFQWVNWARQGRRRPTGSQVEAFSFLFLFAVFVLGCLFGGFLGPLFSAFFGGFAGREFEADFTVGGVESEVGGEGAFGALGDETREEAGFAFGQKLHHFFFR